MKKILTVICIALLSAVACLGQDLSIKERTDTSAVNLLPFSMVDVKPTFQDGDATAFSAWVHSHLEYPEIARESGIQGRVTLQFVIETDGSITNVKVLRGVDHHLDKEAVRVVSSAPKWNPGYDSDGKPVRVTYVFPVIFNLR